MVGAVAQWHAGEVSARRDAAGEWHTTAAGSSGHVAIVVKVLPDGQVRIVAAAGDLPSPDGPVSVVFAGDGGAPR